eukprot:scaffold78891_cov27-Phaeocystis_antarctica.AAC.1
MPQQPLAKHPGKRMRDAIRWMDRATADAHGVPAGSVGFELVDPTLFSDEVYYPQSNPSPSPNPNRKPHPHPHPHPHRNPHPHQVYPQWRSGSFRKTAKHWGLTSPKPKQHS